MSLELLKPISEEAITHTHLMPRHVLGNAIKRHTKAEGLPDLGNVQIALIGIQENRNAYFPTLSYDITGFRKSFYALYPGNWDITIADLGDLPNGKTAEDTYFAIHEVCFQLRQINVLPVFIGGSNDLVYPLYRSYQKNNQFINMVSVDNQFDFSQDEELISGRSYMSQIIMEQPNLLKHFTNIGYQAYYIAQEELDLMDKLSFDALRLGVVLDDVREAEPYIRNADLVGIDMKVLSAIAAGNYTNGQPNGMDSRTICALSRYAGICDRVST
ncbi:MAG: formimidoylglutamase, partial [Flavobacteriaceae bacterium]